MTLSDINKPVYFYRQEFDKLALTRPDCKGLACLSCPLHLPYDIYQTNGKCPECLKYILIDLNNNLPVICTVCGHVITRRPA